MTAKAATKSAAPRQAEGPARPDTLAIVVTWNKREVLDRMLASLRASSPPGQFDVLVVDNASTDGTVEMIRANHPWAEVLEHAENLGGTGGFNAGMREGLLRGYKYLWLMDNDIVVHPGCHEALRATMDSDPRIGLVGSHVLYIENPERTQEVGSWIDWRSGKLEQFDKDALRPGPHLNAIDFSSACSCLARAAAVHQVGTWDPAYFIAFDDVDWGIRLNRGGWRVVATTEARVEHASYFSRRPRQGLVSFYYSVRNCCYCFRRHGRRRDNLRLFFNHLRPVLGDALLFRAAGKGEFARALLCAVDDFFAQKMGKCAHTFDFSQARERAEMPKLRERPRLLLLGAIDRRTIEEQLALLDRSYPDATVEVFISADSQELIAADVPRATIVPFQSFWQRLRFLLKSLGKYDAIFALEVVRPHLFEETAPWSCRLDPDGYAVRTTRGGVGRFVQKAAIRLASAAMAAPLAVAATLWPMPRPNYFTYLEGRDRDLSFKPHSEHRRTPITYAMALVNYAFVFAAIVVLTPIMWLLCRLKFGPKRRRADEATGPVHRFADAPASSSATPIAVATD